MAHVLVLNGDAPIVGDVLLDTPPVQPIRIKLTKDWILSR